MLALYGAYSIISGILNLTLSAGIYRDDRIKTVLIVKDAEEIIEGIVRGIFTDESYRKNVHTCKFTIIDMDSSDDTAKVLRRLERKYGSMDVLGKNEKDLVFLDFSHRAN